MCFKVLIDFYFTLHLRITLRDVVLYSISFLTLGATSLQTLSLSFEVVLVAHTTTVLEEFTAHWGGVVEEAIVTPKTGSCFWSQFTGRCVTEGQYISGNVNIKIFSVKQQTFRRNVAYRFHWKESVQRQNQVLLDLNLAPHFSYSAVLCPQTDRFNQ